ncbi:MAG: hypothetical protein ACKN9C_09455, partial [Fluviibacter sp.]
TINAARRLDTPLDLNPGLYRVGSEAIGVCGDKMTLLITEFLVDGVPGTPDALPEAVVTL